MMKIFSLILLMTANVLFANAQTQRKKNNPPTTAADSVTSVTGKPNQQKKQMLKELNLSKIQKSKLKAIRQMAKQQKEAIDNDETLSPAQRETKLKDLKREQAKNTMDILNEEQKAAMKKMRKAQNEKLMDDEND